MFINYQPGKLRDMKCYWKQEEGEMKASGKFVANTYSLYLTWEFWGPSYNTIEHVTFHVILLAFCSVPKETKTLGE